jgi:hypothetical protein
MIVVLIIYIIFLICYLFFIWTILWHSKKYIPPNDASMWVIKMFIIGSALLIIISLILFFMVPWDNLFKFNNLTQKLY